MFEELHARMRNLARWENNTIRLMGVIEIVLGISLLVPAVAALYYGEDTMVFLYPVPFLLILGTLQYFLFRRGKAIKPAGGLLMIFLAWWITFFVSSIPFYLSGFSYVDSLFESVSGFTTTGISVIAGAGTPQSILFWAALTQWAGGIAIVLVFLFLIPMMSIGGRTFVNNELVGSETHNFSLKVRSIVGNFISIYILLSVVEAVLLMISGVGPFESVTM
ncbi:MAG: TrkH family potassium uptake protein, partial [Methanomassiliicoccaceae archaeon]|nr:TrkH family potassium uptake protein [Methanomassiliicoccaceae archaeon]